jgi:putative transposase
MPNHFHLVIYPKKDNDLSEFMRWLTTTHVRQVRVLTGSVGHGHLYQGAYKSFPVEGDKHLVDLIRYVEQNPFRAGLVKKAQDWLWSSLYIRNYGTSRQNKILDELPTELPHNYLSSVNEIYDSGKLSRLRNSITKGLPYGSDKWTDSMVEKYNLVATTRGVGRPKRV